ncbi:MAG TPA: hypothetical protein VE977_17435 [Pyrinomonadaceae bacterium]|nr:hypothetical protein [Pyrinomonadaceae bacterium]
MLGIVAMLVGIGCLICFIIVLIKLFQNEGALKGILGLICGLYTFIWGWMNSDKLGIRNIMMIWTLLIIIQLLLNFVFGVAMIPGYPPRAAPVIP